MSHQPTDCTLKLLKEAGPLLQVKETPRRIPAAPGVQGSSGGPWVKEPAPAMARTFPWPAQVKLHCTGNAEDRSHKPAVKTPGWHAKRPFFASKAS